MTGDWGLSIGLIASIAAAMVSTIGLLSMAALGDWGRRNSAYFSAFAIGILTVAVFFHLAPESFSYARDSWKWAVGGLFAMSLIGFAIQLATREPSNDHGLAFGFASVVALGFHSFVDGLIYEATYQAELFTGQIATAALLLHEFPEGVIAFFLVREAGLSTPWALLWAFIASSLTTIAGALLAGVFIENSGSIPFGALLGAAAGCLLYIMIFHLGPHASRTPHKRGYMMASFGVAVAIAALVLHRAHP